MLANCPFYGSCTVDQQGSTQCNCPASYSCSEGTICASNGLTYSDECKMKEYSCEKKKELVVVHKGACGK